MYLFRLIVIFVVAYSFMATSAFCYDSHESDAQVWKVGQNRWTIHDEYSYGQWIETNITEDFLIRHKIPVDCADVPYAIRWIYARIHHLPAAATTVDNRFIGHWSKDWAHLPTSTTWDKDSRFRAALLYMLSSTSTRTLPSDTYPIRVAVDSVTAGTVFLFARDHAGIVSRIVMDGSTAHPVQTFEAGSPARIKRLRLGDFLLPNLNYDHISGLLKFRWPVNMGSQWHYLPDEEQPFHSEEQYSPEFTEEHANYLEAVEKRINPTVYEPGEKVEKIIKTVTRRLIARIPIILDGHKKCHELQCPEGSLYWEIYGTYNRDELIRVLFYYLETIIKNNHLDRDVILDKMKKIYLQISSDRFVTLEYVFQNFKWMSSDPEATIEARWGLDKCNIIALHLKSAQESISFIQEKYGKTDPHFTERSIWKKQKIVDEMNRESQKNNCTIGRFVATDNQ